MNNCQMPKSETQSHPETPSPHSLHHQVLSFYLQVALKSSLSSPFLSLPLPSSGPLTQTTVVAPPQASPSTPATTT